MGQNCCAAARGKSLPNRNNYEASTYRNVRQSPNWSFRWDNRTHIEDIMENPTTFTQQNCGNSTSEVKSVVNGETDGLSDSGSPPKAFQSSQLRKSSTSGGMENSKFIAADQSASSNSSLKRNRSHKSSVLPCAFDANPLVPAKINDPSSSSALFIPPDPNCSRKAARSQAFQLYRQFTDARARSPEGKIPSPEESHGGSSDGWSMRTFSELVASSQRERWSFDGENLSTTGKVIGSGLELKDDDPPNLQPCGICSKLLDDLPPCTRYLGHPVAAVLVCGHVFHAECLESLTPEAEMYDPLCRVCTHNGDRHALKPKKRSSISRAADVTTDVTVDSGSGHTKRSGKGPIMGMSSSMKSSLGRPFLRRHFSVGSRPARSASEHETARKKWFWPRYHRE